MTVLLRVKRRPDADIRARRRATREAAAHAPAASPQAPRPPAARTPAGHALGTDPRTLPTQDRATYSCGCGYVFSQDVSTSVACPHCGDFQAW